MKRTKAWKLAHRIVSGRVNHRAVRCPPRSREKQREVPDFLIKLVGKVQARNFCNDVVFRHRHD